MKTTVALLAIAVIAFLAHRSFRSPSSSLPHGHDHAPDGVYFLRVARTVTTSAGPVQWIPGQQVFADRLSKVTAPEGMILVTDGNNSAAVPANMLSEDVQEGESLRALETNRQARDETMAREAKQTEQAAAREAQERVNAERERLRSEAQQKAEQKVEQDRQRALEASRATPTPKFGQTSLDQPTVPMSTKSGGRTRYYYGPAIPRSSPSQ